MSLTPLRFFMLMALISLRGSAVAADGNNSFAGFTFPKTVASFQLQKIEKEEPDGIIASYTGPTGSITVFIYPALVAYSPQALRAHYNQCRGHIFDQHKAVKTLKEHRTAAHGKSRTYPGFEGVFAYTDVFDGDEVQQRSWLFVFQKDRYTVKYRATCPMVFAERGAAAVARFVKSFDWPD